MLDLFRLDTWKNKLGKTNQDIEEEQEQEIDLGLEEEEVLNIDDVLKDDNMIRSIYPFSWEELPDHIESGNNFIRVLAITSYPKKRYGNWLSELKRKKGNITVVQHFESNNSDIMLNHYDQAIKNKEAELLSTHDPLKRKRLENQIDTANRQMNKYLENKSHYIYQSMYVYLTADSMAELDTLTDSVMNTLKKQQLRVVNPIKAQYHAFWSALPLNKNLLREYTYQQSNTDVASSTFPFDDSEILNLTPRSDIEGINKDTNSLIAVDYSDKRNVLNQNMVVLGTSGVGKTTYMKQKIMSDIAKGKRVFIIDPENEYSQIVKKYGGDVVHLSSHSKTIINPLEIYTNVVLNEEDTDDGNTSTIDDMNQLVKNKIQRVKDFFQVLKKDLDDVEKSILDSVLRTVYKNSGILKYASLDDINSDEFPILEDVYKELERLKTGSPDDRERFEEVKQFYYILEVYVYGSNTMFNGTTNISIDSHLLSFDLKPLQNEPESQEGAYLNTFSYLWDEITKNKNENIKLYVDEFHFLTRNPSASGFFVSAYKQFRKYNAGAIAGTQQIEDVLDGTTNEGKNTGVAIIGNSYTKVFFGLDESGLRKVEDSLHIQFSEKESRELAQKKQGQALLINGSKRALMNVQLSQEELRVLDIKQYATTYHDYTQNEVESKTDQELYEEIDKPDYHERIKMTPVEEEEALSFKS